MSASTHALEAGPQSLDTLSLRRRLQLFLSVLGIVALLSVLKALMNWMEWEFLALNPLFTSDVRKDAFCAIEIIVFA